MKTPIPIKRILPIDVAKKSEKTLFITFPNHIDKIETKKEISNNTILPI